MAILSPYGVRFRERKVYKKKRVDRIDFLWKKIVYVLKYSDYVSREYSIDEKEYICIVQRTGPIETLSQRYIVVMVKDI